MKSASETNVWQQPYKASCQDTVQGEFSVWTQVKVKDGSGTDPYLPVLRLWPGVLDHSFGASWGTCGTLELAEAKGLTSIMQWAPSLKGTWRSSYVLMSSKRQKAGFSFYTSGSHAKVNWHVNT